MPNHLEEGHKPNAKLPLKEYHKCLLMLVSNEIEVASLPQQQVQFINKTLRNCNNELSAE